MAFGSAFWSAEPEKTWAFVDTMLEKNVPFVRVADSWCQMLDTDSVASSAIDPISLVALRQSPSRDTREGRSIRKWPSDTVGPAAAYPEPPRASRDWIATTMFSLTTFVTGYGLVRHTLWYQQHSRSHLWWCPTVRPVQTFMR